jgi:nucleotide-binding universal stress UspA family protein
MVKKILVPIAFSKYARGIIDYAAELASATGAELVVVNVINERDLQAVDKITSFGYKVDIEHYVDTIKKERKQLLNELLEHLTLPDDRVTYTFCLGEPTEELLSLVIDRQIDMVVMGVKSNDISHIFTGSVAERMFRKCPVTIVSYRGGEVADRLRRRVLKHQGKKE